jgi:hypothetical protein
MSTVDVQERWVRWGHKRKPNEIVLKLYSGFDWFGDFIPMFRVFFHWIGRTAMATWERLGQSIMILVNLALMGGIIYLSVHHSYRLCVWVGYSGIDAWVAVGVFETIFVYCSQVIQNSFKRGKKQGVMPWIGFLAGFAFVVTSNYMGMADHRLAKIIGISLPCLLLIMKGVLAYQFRQARKEVQTKNENLIKKKKTRWWHRLFFWRKKDNEVLENTSTTSKKIASDPTGEKTPAQNITSSPEKSPVEITTSASGDITSNQITTTSGDITSNQITTTSGKITSDKKSPAKNVTSSKKRNTTSKKKTSGKVVDITKKSDEKVMELALIALQIKNDEGECGRPRLIKHTGCTDHYAKKAIKLMEELEEKDVTPEELSPTGEITSDKKSPATGEKTPPADNLASEEESPAPANDESPAPATGEKTPPADNLTSEEESPAPAKGESPAPAPTSVKLVTQ